MQGVRENEKSKRYARLGNGPRDWTILADFSIARGARQARAIAERPARLDEGRGICGFFVAAVGKLTAARPPPGPPLRRGGGIVDARGLCHFVSK